MLFGITRISRGKLSGPPVRLVEESNGVTKKISRCWSPRRSMSSLSIKLPESLPNTFQIKDRQIIKLGSISFRDRATIRIVGGALKPVYRGLSSVYRTTATA
ncbi:hypothetical protein GQ600_19942 [Phytophthora cactorum]|nr:hypothetical protein GQ600_19942 [Phytophthora cactorum]